MALDWTTMVNQVVVAGRPGDVEDAALGWEELIGNVRDVCTALDRDLKGLESFWSGDAAEAFSKHVGEVGKELKRLTDTAAPESGQGIVETLRSAARDLQAAQAAMPIPATMIGEVMAARDSRVYIGPGVLEIELRAGFFDSAPMKAVGWLTDQFRSFLSDVEDDAREAYDKVDGQHTSTADRAPDAGVGHTPDTPTVTPPDLGDGGPGKGGVGKMPDIGGGGGDKLPNGLGNTGGGPDLTTMPGVLDGSPIKPPDGSGLDDFKPGSGLAGAGGGLTTGTPGLGGGLGSGGLGSGGLGGGGGGLGGGAGGLGGVGMGRIPGGGSLGKPITPGIAPVAGGLAGRGGAGALRGGMAGAGRPGGGMAGIGGIGGAGAAGGGRGATGRGAGGLGGVAGTGAAAGRPGGARGGMAARGAGFMGGPGPGDGGEEDEYDSWLYEDEDVWREGSDVPPPGVLGN